MTDKPTREEIEAAIAKTERICKATSCGQFDWPAHMGEVKALKIVFSAARAYLASLDVSAPGVCKEHAEYLFGDEGSPKDGPGEPPDMRFIHPKDDPQQPLIEEEGYPVSALLEENARLRKAGDEVDDEHINALKAAEARIKELEAANVDKLNQIKSDGDIIEGLKVLINELEESNIIAAENHQLKARIKKLAALLDRTVAQLQPGNLRHDIRIALAAAEKGKP